jgi:hypothetical protein
MKTLIASIIAMTATSAVADGLYTDTRAGRQGEVYTAQADIGYTFGDRRSEFTPFITIGAATDRETVGGMYGGGLIYEAEGTRGERFRVEASVRQADDFDATDVRFSMGLRF